MCEGIGQVGHARTFADRRIERDHVMRFVGQDRLDQSCQRPAWSDLDECPHTGASHVANLLDELDRLGDLLGQNIADHLRIARILAGCRVGEDGQLSGVERDWLQGGAERLGGAGDQRAVERGRDRQTDVGHLS